MVQEAGSSHTLVASQCCVKQEIMNVKCLYGPVGSIDFSRAVSLNSNDDRHPHTRSERKCTKICKSSCDLCRREKKPLEVQKNGIARACIEE
jgi:hypothetical protein